MLPSRSSKRLQEMLPERPSAFVNASALPSCTWMSPRPSVPIQRPPSRSRSSLLELTFRSGSSAAGLVALRIGYGSSLSPTSCLSPAPLHADQESSVLGRAQVTQPHSRQSHIVLEARVSIAKARFPRQPTERPSCPPPDSRRTCRSRHPADGIARARRGFRRAGLPYASTPAHTVPSRSSSSDVTKSLSSSG